MLEFPVKTVFEASHNSDSMEGRGHKIIDGYFTTREEALKAVKGTGGWGQDGDITKVTPMVVFETFEEYVDHKNKDIRAMALNKLSIQERKALGLWKEDPPAKTTSKDRALAAMLDSPKKADVQRVKLRHDTIWESHEFYLEGKEMLIPRQLSKIKEVFVDGEKFEVRAVEVTGHYSDHGHPGSATSTILQIKMSQGSVHFWVPLHGFIDNNHVVEISSETI